MSRHKKPKKTKVYVEDPEKRTGHYNYQSKQKSKFNNRPKRLRTRKTVLEHELRDYI